MEARRKNLKRALGAGCALAVLAMATGAAAQQRTFNIASSKATDAIPEFARQAGIQIVAPAERLRGVNTPAIAGQYDTREALAMLIEGTGLRIVSDDGRTVMLAAADPQSGSAAGAGAEVEALIVTAQKREEDIQDVPIAISAFTQEDLDRSQVAGGPDLMTQVPNMTFTKTNFSSYSIQIRGIGTQAISATTDPAVAIAFNNTPFVRNRFFEQEFYDLQRVEVLRGPQGTLYGRNATAGVVNIISNKPTFGYEAKASGDVANYNSSRLEGMVNIPLAEDVAALRIAGAWTKREGYSTNEITGNPIDGRDLWSTRLSLRLAPTDRLDVNLIWEHFEEDDDRLRSGKQVCHRHVPTEVGGIPIPAPGTSGFDSSDPHGFFSQGCIAASMYAPESYEAPNGYALPYYHPLSALTFYNVPGLDPYASTTQSRDLRVIESTLDPEYRAKSDAFELQANFDLSESLSVASETSYATDRIFSFQDYNRFNTRSGAWRTDFEPGEYAYRPNLIRPDGSFCDPQLGCADRLVAGDVSTAKSVQFSQEFRLSSNFDGPFNFNLGANYLRYDTEDKYYVFINSLTLFAASRGASGTGWVQDPWVVGESDNLECLGYDGPVQPIPDEVYGPVGCIPIDPNPIGSLNDQGHNYFLSRNPYKLMSYAVFGEAYYNVTDDLKVTAGMRWTVDKKEAPRIPSWVVGADTIGYPVAEVVEQEWREPTGRLTIDWKPDLAFTDDTLLYASAAHGYKAGGANPPAAGLVIYGTDELGDVVQEQSVAKPRTFDPEFVNAFEVGSKNTLADGRVTMNLAAFFYDYDGYQISYITDRSAVNLNFDAKVWGLEIEADWRPLENLRLGFKGGYQDTDVADGERAIDVMDRTAGNPDWVVLRPHPARTSNCIFPADGLREDGFGNVRPPAPVGSAGLTGCESLWLMGVDPYTLEAYNPLDPNGIDPASMPAEANNGEGFFKDLSGNELPNAPHFTATITADYTVPLPSDWLMTLHTDLYYQSEAWTRIFNTEGYDKLKAYTNVNLAAIFANEDAGWKVMAYIKNVFDRDSITGSFLNSDDTGLTTNVFLTEPRLYGLRVTKEWSGGPWWTGANLGHAGPYPLTIELSGQVQRLDAPYETISPSFAGEFFDAISTVKQSQHNDLDWGDGRTVKLTYRPGDGPWKVSAAVRYGRTNGSGPRVRAEEESESGCAFAGDYAFMCALNPAPLQENGYYLSQTNWSLSYSTSREKHDIVDFAVGREFDLGGLSNSVSLGLRYANFQSATEMETSGRPDWYIPDGFLAKYAMTHTYHQAALDTERNFEGSGPVVAWDGALALWTAKEQGTFALDWSVGGGALFGKQETTMVGHEESRGYSTIGLSIEPPDPIEVTQTDVDLTRTKDVTVPLLDLSLGLSYDVGRIKVGAGYRWERYFDVLDVGNTSRRDADRTIDGPYFKIAVGFGG